MQPQSTYRPSRSSIFLDTLESARGRAFSREHALSLTFPASIGDTGKLASCIINGSIGRGWYTRQVAAVNKVNTRATVQSADFTFPRRGSRLSFYSVSFFRFFLFSFFARGESKTESWQAERESASKVLKNRSPDVPFGGLFQFRDIYFHEIDGNSGFLFDVKKFPPE